MSYTTEDDVNISMFTNNLTKLNIRVVPILVIIYMIATYIIYYNNAQFSKKITNFLFSKVDIIFSLTFLRLN